MAHDFLTTTSKNKCFAAAVNAQQKYETRLISDNSKIVCASRVHQLVIASNPDNNFHTT